MYELKAPLIISSSGFFSIPTGFHMSRKAKPGTMSIGGDMSPAPLYHNGTGFSSVALSWCFDAYRHLMVQERWTAFSMPTPRKSTIYKMQRNNVSYWSQAYLHYDIHFKRYYILLFKMKSHLTSEALIAPTLNHTHRSHCYWRRPAKTYNESSHHCFPTAIRA